MSDGIPTLVKCERSDGAILSCASPGRAFMLVPAVPSHNSAAGTPPVAVPGSFPVRVRFKGGGKKGTMDVPNSQVHVYDPDDGFQDFDILDADVGDYWLVYVFESPHAGVFPAPTKTKIPVRVTASAVALAQTSPTLVTDGWPLRPNLTNFTAYFSGTARVNRLWVRLLDGTWFDTGVDYDQTATGERMQPFTVGVPGDRFTFVASGASQSVIIEGAFEAG